MYGPSRVEADRLRDRKSKIGLLDVRALPVSSDDMLILPKADEETFCRSTKPAIKPCFLAGDFRRVNENQGMANSKSTGCFAKKSVQKQKVGQR